MPFRHPDRSHGLPTRIELEVRERIEEAVDYVCLDLVVRRRRERGLPAPAADSAADRAEYQATVCGFLRRLAAELDRSPAAGDEGALLASQVRLARTLPDYWQRFEVISARFTADAIGSDAPTMTGGQLDGRDVDSSSRSAASPDALGSARRGLLGRLFGRG